MNRDRAGWRTGRSDTDSGEGSDMKAVQLTSGDYLAHYLVDDPATWDAEIRVHPGLGLERLEYREVPDPRPGPGEVLVEVGGCGLNHLDVWAVKSPRGHRRSEPRIPGADVAGVVRAVGPGVRTRAVGDRVVLFPFVACGQCYACASGRGNLCEARGASFGSSRDGGLAEYTTAPEANALPIPGRLSVTDAAAVPIAFLTAWHMTVTRAQVRPGETVLVHAAGSGVGMAAIQVARLLAARVLVTAGADAKIRAAMALGAEAGIDYRTDAWPEEVRRLTGGRGVDVVIDSLCGAVLERSAELLAPGGRLVTCGCTLGNWARLNVARLLSREVAVMTAVLGTRREFLDVLRQLDAGTLRPVVDRVFPLSRAREAVAHLADRAQFGKVVVVPDARYAAGPRA
jgi:NADPH:quinone reductase-like Zn-dependent oxidoreductase